MRDPRHGFVHLYEESFMSQQAPYHPELQCFVSRIGYNFSVHVGQVLMTDGGCTDMSGCIEFFKRIDPEVKTIRTYSDSEPDTVYFVRNGEWHAVQGRAE